MLKIVSGFAMACILAASLPTAALSSQTPPVKLSRNKICHPKGSEGYNQTKNFTPFSSLEECLKEGRLRNDSRASETPAVQAKGDYARDAFGGWADFDGDCVNTRHEVLKEQSTGQVVMKNRCSVERGRWLDPYTGKIFNKAADVDIDHLVPLAYAWSRGAEDWTREKRERFANDPANLFVVDRSTNREKGAKGVSEWLPPQSDFRCQYILRFQRVVKSYQLQQSASERALIESRRDKHC